MHGYITPQPEETPLGLPSVSFRCPHSALFYVMKYCSFVSIPYSTPRTSRSSRKPRFPAVGMTSEISVGSALVLIVDRPGIVEMCVCAKLCYLMCTQGLCGVHMFHTYFISMYLRICNHIKQEDQCCGVDCTLLLSVSVPCISRCEGSDSSYP